jgi:hypothetical protein
MVSRAVFTADEFIISSTVVYRGTDCDAATFSFLAEEPEVVLDVELDGSECRELGAKLEGKLGVFFASKLDSEL